LYKRVKEVEYELETEREKMKTISEKLSSGGSRDSHTMSMLDEHEKPVPEVSENPKRLLKGDSFVDEGLISLQFNQSLVRYQSD